MKSSVSSFIPPTGALFLTMLCLSLPIHAPAQTCCPETNSIKWVQRPDTTTGVDFGYFATHQFGIVLADDFQCTNKGTIAEIHLWQSWDSDVLFPNQTFTLGIWSDVPAGVTTNYSHPGTLLWSQTFTNGQYYLCFYTNAPEDHYAWPVTFPQNPAVSGRSTNLFYLCFYPANPFTQNGSQSSPTNYWLSVYAPPSNWKSSLDAYGDSAVAGNYPGTNWSPLTNPVLGGPLNFAFKINTTVTNQQTPPPCCPETNGLKWIQRPDLASGIDYDATLPFTVADDFQCTNSGRITDIHLWGSWLSDQVDLNATYTLAIWSDAPTNTDRPFSHPGNLVWSQVFPPNTYTICPYTNAVEPFYNPGANVALGGSTNLYYLCFFPDPANIFRQSGSPTQPTNYWLSVTVQSSSPAAPIDFGWKSSVDHYNDTAVQTTVAFPPPSASWTPFYVPTNGAHVDLAFKITTDTNTPPPVVCVESDFEKYVQGPRLLNGFDVWNTPYVLADDFICTNTGPVSDIHLWGSWLNDVAYTNTIVFWLGIYDDMPVGGPGNTNTFSHPGTNLLWQQWFNPGQYAETVWATNAMEHFLDPGTLNTPGTDSVVWYFCFYPTNAFQQTGTITNSKTYWLAAYAQLPVGANYNYGWKTATNVLNDTSVHATWTGSPPIANPGWTPTAEQPPVGGPPVPLDLAFKLTMCSPVRIHWLPPTNVVVTWSGAGYLQSATNVAGPYVDVPGFPTSPYTDYSVTPTNKFYRLRCY
jgi:hypothetical protein